MSDFDAFWAKACTQLTDFDERQARWLWDRAQEAQEQRIRVLEAALRTIQREAHGIDQYLYDVASEALSDE